MIMIQLFFQEFVKNNLKVLRFEEFYSLNELSTFNTQIKREIQWNVQIKQLHWTLRFFQVGTFMVNFTFMQKLIGKT